jgi:hypothetical protein
MQKQTLFLQYNHRLHLTKYTPGEPVTVLWERDLKKQRLVEDPYSIATISS